MNNDNNENVDATDIIDTSSSTVNAASSWILAAFIFMILGWVFSFTMMAAHTDAARYHIYPCFESTYFDRKAGARVFTYLGVFHIAAGAIILWFLSRGIRLCRPPLCLVSTPMRIPITGEYWTILEIIVVAFFVAVQGSTILVRAYRKFHNDWDPERDSSKVWYEISTTLGKTAAITILFLLLPIAKSCFWLDLFNYKFERAVKFHRWLAWFLVWVVVIHATAAITSLLIAKHFKACMWPSNKCISPATSDWGTYDSVKNSRTIDYGWLSALVALPLVISSTPWFRRNKFEWFYFTHFLFVPFFILLHLHYDQFIYYAAPGLAAYLLDKVIFWCSTRSHSKIISLTTPAPGFVRMTIALADGKAFEPGQWVLIKVPVISRLQWHPMSIASGAIADQPQNCITLDFKVLGDWTRRLHTLAIDWDPAQNLVCVASPHGNSHSQLTSYLNHPAVIMFAGGIGITPMISALRTTIVSNKGGDGSPPSQFPIVRRVVLVWCVRRLSVVNLYRDELARLQSLQGGPYRCEVQVIVHATLSENEDNDEAAHFVAIDFDSKDTKDTPHDGSQHGPKRCCGLTETPWLRGLQGYYHQLVLTLGAGGGYLLGIFIANVMIVEIGPWRFEYNALLQLGLALFFASIVSFGLMDRNVFFYVSSFGSMLTRTEKNSHQRLQNDANEVAIKTTKEKESHRHHHHHHHPNSSKHGTSAAANENMPVSHCPELSVCLGCRPDTEEITNEMKNWCTENNVSSVGVAVCGPDSLVQSVTRACNQASSSCVHFVVDAETFEW